MIRFSHVTKRFNSQSVIDNVDLELPEAGLVILSGRMGSGKTVFLKLLAGLERPSFGTIEVAGQNITSKNERALTKYREESVSFIYSKEFLIDKLTVEENIRLASREDISSETIEKLNLHNILDKRVEDLTLKEKSLVEVARGISKNSKVLLVDDPIILADSSYRSTILQILKELSRSRLVILTVGEREIENNYGDISIHLVSGQIEKIRTINTENNLVEEYHADKKFSHFKFANKVLFSNKKKIAKTSILFLMSLLSFLLSFSLFSIDYIDMETNTMVKEKDTDVFIRKVERETDHYKYVDYTEEDIMYLSKSLDVPFSLGKKIDIEGKFISFDIDYASTETVDSFHSVHLKDFTFFPSTSCDEIVLGRLPQRKDEIVISSYLADIIINYGIKDITGKYYKPTSYEELVGQRQAIDLAGIGVYVSGIYRLELDNFESLKKKFDEFTFSRFNVYITNNANRIFVNDEFLDMYKNYKPSFQKRYSLVLIPGHEDLFEYVPGRDLNFSIFTKPVSIKREEAPVLNLLEDEIIINGSLLNDIGKSPETAIGSVVEIYVEDSVTKTTKKLQPMKVVGISQDGKNYIDKSVVDQYLVDPIVYQQIRLQCDDPSLIKTVLNEYTEQSGYYVTTNYTYILKKLSTILPKVALTIFILGFILLFASLIFMLNYIFYSLDDHKKDIGVLKSLGVSNLDIYKVFGIETLTLIIKGYIFATIGYFILRFIINVTASRIISFEVDILPIRLFLFVILFSIVIVISSLIATLYYMKIRKLKTVD